MTAPLIEVRGLCKSFAGVRVLIDVDFELRRGEVHALMGENGAGKSTLMKILAGVHGRDAGQIQMDGQPVPLGSPAAAQALGIGIIHQELQLMPHLSAAQNLFIGREPRRLGGWWLDEAGLNRAAAQVFRRLNLALDPRTPVGELTVARQQMVEIAKALSRDSRVLIMDEPTAALNAAEVDDLFRVIGQLRAEGVGLVYISHRMDELQRIADRVTVLRDGRSIGTVPMAGTATGTLIEMMVGRALAAPPPRLPPPAGALVALAVHDLRRGRAVRGVSLNLRRGEIVGLAGLMGAGRTELARLIFGADRADGGRIEVHGRPVAIRSPADAVACGIGYLSEDRKQFGLATGLDVESNIVLASLPRFVRRFGRVDAAACTQAAQQLVQKLQIKTASLRQTVRLLSGGNQQKIVIAKWLLRDCDILIFDEPTRGIDVGAKAEIHRWMQSLAADGKALIVISSELPEVLRLAHRVLVMCEGRLTGELPIEAATQQQIMALATRHQAVSAPFHPAAAGEHR